MEMRDIVALFKALSEVGVVEDVKTAYALGANLRAAEVLVRDRDKLVQAAIKRHDASGRGHLTIDQKRELDLTVENIDSEEFDIKIRKVSLAKLEGVQLSPSMMAGLVAVIKDEDEEAE